MAGGPGDERVPRWSPDGRYLAYVSSVEQGTFVYLCPPHGGTPRRLIDTNVPTLKAGSSFMGDRPWSLDSRTLLVSRIGESGQMALYRVDRETGDAERLTDPPPGNEDRSPSYSFDGERIVFERRANSTGMLMIMPSAGGEPEVLLDDGFDNAAPGLASRQSPCRLSVDPRRSPSQSLGDRLFHR